MYRIGRKAAYRLSQPATACWERVEAADADYSSTMSYYNGQRYDGFGAQHSNQQNVGVGR